MIKKYRVLAVLVPALAIIATIAIRPMYWLGSIGFGWIMFWLTVAVGVLVTYAWVSHNTKSAIKSFLAILLALALVVGIVMAGYLLYSSAPDISASEVKSIVNARLQNYSRYVRTVSAEYEGQGTWRIRALNTEGVIYLHFYEGTGEVRGTISDLKKLSEPTYQPNLPTPGAPGTPDLQELLNRLRSKR